MTTQPKLESTIIAYPIAWEGVYNLITVPVPVDAFPEAVQGNLFLMAAAGVLDIVSGFVMRPNALPVHFKNQLERRVA